MPQPSANLLAPLEPLLDHPVLIPGEHAFDVGHEFLVLVVQVIDTYRRDHDRVGALENFLDPCAVLLVAPAEAVIVDYDDRIVKVVFDVAEQAFEFGSEFNAVGTADFPVDHIVPSVLASEIGEGGFVFEQNVFLVVRIIATLAQIDGHFVDFLWFHDGFHSMCDMNIGTA
ncbi:hypothetical protein BM613_10965 [Sulfoacidibacillus thermotolerans]|uniref:Uncharacterized protein n=1 Tax=Sulfoacidibacillus thermotolerans TaxID=1765684 RepID=A0A2U3D6W4_SULT2|nr:hypothetical protein BM613_10965 [Sulfoacidibacillus thermotolerans]